MKATKQRRRPTWRVLNVNHLAKVPPEETFVWILNSVNPEAGEVNVLGYHDGSPRVYLKDDYDPRLKPLYPRLPYAADMEEAVQHFIKLGKPIKGAKPIQVNVKALSEFGFPKRMIRLIENDIDAWKKENKQAA